MFHRTSLLVALGTALLMPAPSFAQQPSRASRGAAGPRLEVTAAGVRSSALIRDTTGYSSLPEFSAPRPDADRAAASPAQRQSMGKPVALMVVGGAAVVLGAVIGDAPGTLFMIGGTVAFLYGLYQYLQ